MNYPPRLRKAIVKRRSKTGWNVHQFGQTASWSTWGGSTGCTHTVLQWLAYLWLGKKYTHANISAISGYPSHNAARRGMRPYEVQRFCDAVGLPYRVKLGLSAAEVRELSKKGPVGFGHAYSHWPEWKGYRYGGHVSDGRPNGYAKPSGKAGKNQLAGFTGAHFGMILGVATDPALPDKVYAHEPNHGSAARPQKPPYDVMTVAQFDKVYDSYRMVLGRTRYALVPTKSLPAEGF